MASTLVSGAVSGAITVQGMPSSRARQATPCAMFPADAVNTPRDNVCGVKWPMAFVALQIFELKINLGRCFSDVQPHQRRADSRTRDHSSRVVDVSERRKHGESSQW